MSSNFKEIRSIRTLGKELKRERKRRPTNQLPGQEKRLKNTEDVIARLHKIGNSSVQFAELTASLSKINSM